MIKTLDKISIKAGQGSFPYLNAPAGMGEREIRYKIK